MPRTCPTTRRAPTLRKGSSLGRPRSACPPSTSRPRRRAPGRHPRRRRERPWPVRTSVPLPLRPGREPRRRRAPRESRFVRRSRVPPEASNAPLIQSIVPASPSIATTSKRTSREPPAGLAASQARAAERSRLLLAGVTASAGTPRDASLLHFTSTKTTARRSVATRSISPPPARTVRARTASPRSSRNRAPASSPARPFGVVAGREGAAGFGPARLRRVRPSSASRSFHPRGTGRG